MPISGKADSHENTLGSRRWRRIRARILARDHYRCQCVECKRTGRIRPATEVDHILRREDGGSDDDANLQAINHDCHAVKTAVEDGKRPSYGVTSAGLPLDPKHPWAQEIEAERQKVLDKFAQRKVCSLLKPPKVG